MFPFFAVFLFGVDDVFDLIFYENLALSLENWLDFRYMGGGLGKEGGYVLGEVEGVDVGEEDEDPVEDF